MQHILVVDDDKGVLKIHGRILTEAGYQVDQAGSLKEAEQLLTQNDYQVVLADMNMPDASGCKIVEAIKQLRPQTEVIVITGDGSIKTAVACLKIGAAEFIAKPCHPEQLCELVRKAIEKKELSRENLALRNLNEMKNKFLTLVSHEMRTPLTIINGYAQILRGQSEDFTQDQTESVLSITRAAKHLIKMVDEIQLMTQAEAGKLKLHLQPIQLREMLLEIVAEVKAELGQRQLSLVAKDLEASANIMGDAVRLRQVIVELFHNAVRNTLDGGEIAVTFKEANGFLAIGVRDSGIGIPKTEQAKIFELFYEVADVRFHSTGQGKFGGGGLGLGLSLVKSVVDAHQGKIELESEPGRGTYIALLFPKYISADCLPEPGSLNEPGAGGNVDASAVFHAGK